MPEQLKIAMLSLHSCPLGKLGSRDTGGMNVYIKELALELDQMGHCVDIYTRTHYPHHMPIIKLGQNVRIIHLRIGSDDDIPKLAMYAYLQSFICGVENFRKSSNTNYDLLHSHYWLSALTGKQLKDWWHVPHLCMFHTLAATKNSIGIGEEEPELRIECEREAMESCDHIIAATDREKQELIQHYKVPANKIAIIPCGVNLKLFRPLDKTTARQHLGFNHENLILYVGRIEPLKGLRQVLRALPLITARESTRLIIAGGDEQNQDELTILQNISRELHIEGQVTFVGSVTQDKLPLFYSAADVCVIPSYYESFCMVALESLACGTPIVATNVGGMKDITRQNEIGYLLQDNSPEQIAAGILELLSQNGQEPEHIKIRRDTAARFSWHNIAEKVIQEYNKTFKT